MICITPQPNLLDVNYRRILQMKKEKKKFGITVHIIENFIPHVNDGGSLRWIIACQPK